MRKHIWLSVALAIFAALAVRADEFDDEMNDMLEKAGLLGHPGQPPIPPCHRPVWGGGILVDYPQGATSADKDKIDAERHELIRQAVKEYISCMAQYQSSQRATK
jgi:hypothetical protein